MYVRHSFPYLEGCDIPLNYYDHQRPTRLAATATQVSVWPEFQESAQWLGVLLFSPPLNRMLTHWSCHSIFSSFLSNSWMVGDNVNQGFVCKETTSSGQVPFNGRAMFIFTLFSMGFFCISEQCKHYVTWKMKCQTKLLLIHFRKRFHIKIVMNITMQQGHFVPFLPPDLIEFTFSVV